MATGTFELVEVDAGLAPAVSKGYDARGFDVMINVDSGERYDFPPLKSVKPN